MQQGITFDSSAGFTLPNGAIRSPDPAWIEKSRWQAIPDPKRRKFAPICPDFVIELKSPSDDLPVLQGKLEEYRDNGHEKLTIFMAEARWCSQDSRARNITNNDLPAIGNNFKLAKRNETFDQSNLGFFSNSH